MERENSAIINAALTPLAGRMCEAFEAALGRLALPGSPSLHMTANDGSLLALGDASRWPVRTFASGPTNSMRGALALSGLGDSYVVDIGGTTADVGLLVGGRVRESMIDVTLCGEVDGGGVTISARMPDVQSVGLGGGSIVRVGSDGAVSVGPDSVGHRLLQDSLLAGGTTCTLTDIAAAAGLLPAATIAAIGDASRVAGLSPDLVRSALAIAVATIESAVDRVRLDDVDRPVVVVGGGSILLPADARFRGTSRIVIPERHAGCANALGAALSQAAGRFDGVMPLLAGQTHESRMATAAAAAVDAAVAAGAVPATVRIVESDSVQLAYIPQGAARVCVHAIGDVDWTAAGAPMWVPCHACLG